MRTQTCDVLVEDQSCDFYKTCLEDEYQCGANGYPVGYGYKYCSKFLENINQFSESGQTWIKNTLVCLKKALLPLVDQSSTTCQIIHDTAFDSHPKCYVLNGFCDLFFDPVHILTNVKGLLEVYEIKDLAQPISFKQMLDTAQYCGDGVVKKLYDAVVRILGGGVI